MQPATAGGMRWSGVKGRVGGWKPNREPDQTKTSTMFRWMVGNVLYPGDIAAKKRDHSAKVMAEHYPRTVYKLTTRKSTRGAGS